ncbi:MAG: alpha/beta hydrolase [Anaerolineae bacterium]|nr:alpha/beta hydrolase [Anaerolineae bacterium]
MSDPIIQTQTIAGIKSGVCVTDKAATQQTPVLLLHGWGAKIQSFWPVAENLAPKGYQLHLLDLPGFGISDPPPTTWGVADYMRFVLAYLDSAQLDRVAVIGHSFGGRIALMLAADHPDRISKMILANSAGLVTPPTIKQMIRNGLVRAARDTLGKLGLESLQTRLRERYNQRYASEDYLNAGDLRETFLQVIAQDLTDYARRVQAPTVLVWGDQDTDTPLWQGRKLEQLIPDAGLIVFEGAGHYSYLDRLYDFIRIVDHFLRDTPET